MSPAFGASVAFSVHPEEVGLIRWFADLPIERKLRIVVGAPAVAAFALAVIVPMATNLLHSRSELHRFATRVAGVTGVNVIEALEAADDKGAVKALNALRQEPEAGSVQIALPDRRILATYTQGADGAGARSAGVAVVGPGTFAGVGSAPPHARRVSATAATAKRRFTLRLPSVPSSHPAERSPPRRGSRRRDAPE